MPEASLVRKKGLVRQGRVALSIMAADALLATALLLLGLYMLWLTFINRSFMLILPAVLFISIGVLKMAKTWPVLLATGNAGEPGVLHKSVLVPVSRPETTKSLVEIACNLLEKGGTLRLINVIEVPQQLPYEYAETRKEKARELLMEASKHCESRGVRPKLEIVAARDTPRAILDLADRYKADLIVMGSSQRTVPEKVLFGNVVDRVLREAPCEVVIFSYAKALPPIRYDKILVPTSGYKHAQRALDIALHFQRMSGGLVTSLFVGSDADAEKGNIILKKAKLHAERLGSSVETLFKTGGVVDNIVDVARSGGYSLIIIGATERPSYYTFLLGSTADEIVTRAPCNVLVVRTHK
ncbi:universal stress protein [Methanocella conradii]|uniref:universal stress protein n=1 Tax=Methanocella conradii TaxID=1175444 RepID=UPI0024B39676|nr:universal stress protein [Methanocella conradii]MDI6897685.1 universal stress protein [Methanocella conradii]